MVALRGLTGRFNPRYYYNYDGFMSRALVSWYYDSYVNKLSYSPTFRHGRG
jgi:hypothetical protein